MDNFKLIDFILNKCLKHCIETLNLYSKPNSVQYFVLIVLKIIIQRQ